MKKSGERSKKMIKTDKVVYRTRTLEEYDWLMKKLDEAWCRWADGGSPIEPDEEWDPASDSFIWLEDRTISYSYPEFFYEDYKDKRDYEVIEVSDLMKKDVTTENLDELEVIYKQVSDQIEDLRKQGKEPKAIEYTIKVCFE